MSRTAVHAMTWRNFTRRGAFPSLPHIAFVVFLSTFAPFIVSSLADSSKIAFSRDSSARAEPRSYMDSEKVDYVSKNITKPSFQCNYGSCSQICVLHRQQCR